ncbi:general substrate transporter [Hortaea werneckii]|nr:general substrate transporter [Hortaea werneckii]
MDSVKATSLEECIEACDDEVSCSALVLSGVGCYQKYQANTPTRARGMLAARLIEATSPSASSPATSAPAVTTRPGATPLCPANNAIHVTLTSCLVITLAATSICALRLVQHIQVVLMYLFLGQYACYLKSILNPPTSADGIRGARLRSSASTTSAVSSSMASETPTAYPAPDAFVGTFEYLACYNDSVTNRTLQGAYLFGTSLQNLTLERCATFCDDFQYFGVEYAQECYCGSQLLNNAIQQDPSSCSAPCAGEETQNCGGYNRISVYQNRNFTAVVSSSFSGISATEVATSAIVSPSSSFDASEVTVEPTMSGPTTSEAGSPTPSPLSSETITTSDISSMEGFPTLLPSSNNTDSASNTVILSSNAVELLSSTYFSSQMSSPTSVTLGYNSTGLSMSFNVSVTPTSMVIGNESALRQPTASLSIPNETGLSEVTSFTTPQDSTTSSDGTNSPSSTMIAWTYANTTTTSAPSDMNITSGSSTLAVSPSAFTPNVSVVITSSDTELSYSSEAILLSSETTIVPESESTQTLIATEMPAATSTSTESELSSSSEDGSTSPSAFVSSMEAASSSSEDLLSSTPSAAPVSVTTVEITRTVTNIGTVTVLPIEASASEDDLSTQEPTSTIFEISTSTVVPIVESEEPQLSSSDEETSTVVNFRTSTVVPVEASTSTEQAASDGSADSEITSISATASTAAEAELTTEVSIINDDFLPHKGSVSTYQQSNRQGEKPSYLVAHRKRLLHGPHSLFDLFFPLAPQVPRKLYRVLALEDIANLFQSQAADLWVEEDDQHPAKPTNGSVDETMMLDPQQLQVSHIVPMARTSIGKKSVDIQAVFPTLTPRCRNACCLQLQGFRVDWDEGEGNRDCKETSRHSPDGRDEDPSSSNGVDGHHVDPSHHEVRSSNDKSNSYWIAEADECEERTDQSAKIGRVGVKLLDFHPARALVEFFRFFAGRGNQCNLRADLLNRSTLVDLEQHCFSFLQTAVEDELARRLRTEGQQGGENNGWERSEADHVTPSTADVSEGSTDAIRDDLASGNGHVVQTNEPAANFRWGDFGDVESGTTNAESNDKTPNAHLSDTPLNYSLIASFSPEEASLLSRSVPRRRRSMPLQPLARQTKRRRCCRCRCLEAPHQRPRHGSYR